MFEGSLKFYQKGERTLQENGRLKYVETNVDESRVTYIFNAIFVLLYASYLFLVRTIMRI